MLLCMFSSSRPSATRTSALRAFAPNAAPQRLVFARVRSLVAPAPCFYICAGAPLSRPLIEWLVVNQRPRPYQRTEFCFDWVRTGWRKLVSVRRFKGLWGMIGQRPFRSDCQNFAAFLALLLPQCFHGTLEKSVHSSPLTLAANFFAEGACRCQKLPVLSGWGYRGCKRGGEATAEAWVIYILILFLF
jgi:hypothetical protein